MENKAFTFKKCVEGEGDILLFFEKNSQKLPFSLKTVKDRTNVGIDLPLSGERLFWLSRGGGVSQSIRDLLTKMGLEQSEEVNLVGYFDSLLNETSLRRESGEIGSGLSLVVTPWAKGEGSYKVILNKKVLFINKAYAEARIQFNHCDLNQNFRLK